MSSFVNIFANIVTLQLKFFDKICVLVTYLYGKPLFGKC